MSKETSGAVSSTIEIADYVRMLVPLGWVHQDEDGRGVEETKVSNQGSFWRCTRTERGASNVQYLTYSSPLRSPLDMLVRAVARLVVGLVTCESLVLSVHFGD